jgi:hypothetical protein
VFVTNIHFDKAYTDSIERAAVSQQALVQAQNEAKITVTQARAQADANAILSNSITPNLIAYQQVQNQKAAIARWDGRVPTYDGSGAGLSFLLPVGGAKP